MRLLQAAILAGLMSGCATYHMTLRPLRGIPAADAAWLKQGQLAVPKAQLFDAVATTLEHEPYLHWDIDQLDRANGFIKASAGLFREVQLRITDAGGGRSQLAVSIPRRELKTRAKIWIKRSDPSQVSAYEPDKDQYNGYGVASADVELDDLYFAAFTWHVLHDHAEVPFDLAANPSESPLQALPSPLAAAESPVAVDQAPAAASGTAGAASVNLSPAAGVLSPSAPAGLSPVAAAVPAGLSPAAAP
ncbi:MAG TPA: hypothetical protein VK842_03375 [bacterium]|jgi:hypothetical protein|nr:hypothetical protein [bacterium]